MMLRDAICNIVRAAAILLAVLVEIRGGNVAMRNAVQGACLGIALLSGFLVHGRVADLPLRLGNRAAYLCIAALAVAIGLTTITIPFVSDDFVTLERARRSATPLQWLSPGEPTIGNFFRPLSWWNWWVVEHLFDGSATAARELSIAWFVANGILVMPALRRLGAPRGIAFASALLFVTNPTSVTTIAWLSNYYSQVSLTFILATICALPVRRLTLKNWIPSFLFAFLASVSKEDALLLPAMAFFAGLRMRIFNLRQWKRALIITIPVAAAMGVMVILRIRAVGGLGGYNVGKDEPFQINAWIAGMVSAMERDMPSRYWLPIRGTSGHELFGAAGFQYLNSAVAILATGLFAYSMGRPIARRILPVVVFIAIYSFVPVAGLLDLKLDLETIRLLYLPGFGFALLFAGILAALPFSARARWGLVAILMIAGAAIGWINTDANRYSGSRHREAMRQFTETARAAPPHTRFLLDNLDRTWRGCLFFGGGFPWSFLWSSKRADLELHTLPPTNPGRYDIAWTFNVNANRFEEALGFGEELNLKIGEELTFDFVNNPETRKLFRVSECESFDWREKEWALWPVQSEASVFLKTIVVPSDCKIEFEFDGGWFEDTAKMITTILYKEKRIYQYLVGEAKGEGVLPEGSTRLRLGIHPGLNLGHMLLIRKLTIRAVPKN